jgi:uncharacterized protein
VNVALLDVNVLIALFDDAHVHNAEAHRWLGQNRSKGWASCPITINGCIRIMTSPLYRHLRATPYEVARRMHNFCDNSDHHFWPDAVSLLDDTLFKMPAVTSPKNVTDVYLLGLAVRNHGRLATFDRSIPLNAVTGARPGNLVVIRSV